MKKWSQNRHHVTKWVAQAVLEPYCRIAYGYTYKRFNDVRNRPYLILSNHQTAMDQFLCLMPFPKMVYAVASEDIFSMWAGKIISYLAAPVPFVKSKKNASTIMTCKRIVNEGNSVFMAPEGNRTYSGKTEFINPTVAKFARFLKVPIAFFILRGGYGVRPRWSQHVRKGKMSGSVEQVLEYDVYKEWSDEKLYKYICDALYVDESNDGNVFRSKHLAEYVERALYYCPNCGVTHFVSKGDEFRCEKCGLTAIYGEDKQIKLKDGSPSPFPNVKEWMQAQSNFVVNTVFAKGEIITEDNAAAFRVNLYKNKTLLCRDARLTLYADKLAAQSETWSVALNFADVVKSMTVLGKNKLNVYTDDAIYQFKGDVHFNAVKYVNFFYHNKAKGDSDVEFLGL